MYIPTWLLVALVILLIDKDMLLFIFIICCIGWTITEVFPTFFIIVVSYIESQGFWNSLLHLFGIVSRIVTIIFCVGLIGAGFCMVKDFFEEKFKKEK